MKRIGMLTAALAVLALAGRAAEFYVASDGSDGNGGTDWTNAFVTIGHAVAQADGPGPHTVYVSNGLYTISSEIVLTNTILVRSWNGGTLDPAGTIVDGAAQTRGFRLTHAGAALAGFTVRNGTNEAAGGGVSLTGGGLVTQCVLRANSARDGGGLCITNGGLVTHSTLSENVAVSNSTTAPSRGGGVFIERFGVVSNCQVSANSVASRQSQPSTYNRSGGAGIGIRLNQATNDCRIVGSQVSNNVSAFYGGGIQLFQEITGVTQMTVAGSTVRGNTAAEHGGALAIVYAPSRGGQVTNCVFEANEAKDGGGAWNNSTIGLLMRDCTLRGNTASGSYGGAYNAALFDCLVESNRSGSYGGGAGCSAITNTVSNTVFRGNGVTSANGNGGGFSVYGGGGVNVDIVNCRVYNNSARNYGGGVSLEVGNTNLPQVGRVSGCLIYDNVASNSGGGVRLSGLGYVMSACTVVNNLTTNVNGGGVYVSNGNMTNCIVYSNSARTAATKDLYFNPSALTNNVWYCCSPAAVPPAQGNLAGEPDFADFGAADFRLTAGSPCVNAGTNEPWMENTLDLDGRPRRDPFSGQADIGACEYQPRGSMIRLR